MSSESSPIDHGALAAELFAAEQNRTFVELFTERFDGFTWNDARAVALGVDRLRVDAGDTQIGWKLGWTSAAMREALGISRPNWGTLWKSQRITAPNDAESETAITSRLRHAKVEPELVYVAGQDLDELSTLFEVASTAAGWCFGIEFVDPRFESFQFDWLDNTADNSSAAGVIVGDVTTLDNPASVTMLFNEGEAHFHGAGTQAMGNPVEAVAWLCRSLEADGLHIKAGDIVFTGGLTTPFDFDSTKHYSVTDDDGRLPAVSFGPA